MDARGSACVQAERLALPRRHRTECARWYRRAHQPPPEGPPRPICVRVGTVAHVTPVKEKGLDFEASPLYLLDYLKKQLLFNRLSFGGKTPETVFRGYDQIPVFPLPRTCRDKVSADHIFLQTFERIDLASYRSFTQHFRSFLE